MAPTSRFRIVKWSARRVAIRVAALCVLLPGAVAGQELPFAHYTPASDRTPLPSAEVIKAYQDREGYLWFVIFSSGVVRYDGHSFETYTTSDGLKDLAVWEMLEDGAGRLWVGSNAGLVVSDRALGEYAPGERVRFVSRVGGVPLVETVVNRNRLAADTKGRVWAGTSSSGIVRYRIASDADSLRAECDTLATDPRAEGKNASIRSMVVRRDGSVWVAIGGGNLLAYAAESDTPLVLSQDDGLPTQSITVLYETPEGVLWGGCRNGLVWRLDESTHRIVTVSERLTAPIAGMLPMSDGTLWVASDGDGVMQLNPARLETVAVVTRANGLLSNNVHHVMRDREGSLWLSQSGGASKLRANYAAFRSYTTASGADIPSALPSPAVNVVIPPARGDSTLWLGTTESGVVAVRHDGAVATVGEHAGLSSNWVNGLVFDSEGRLWMGTAAGINCLSLDRRSPPPASPKRSRVRVFDRDGTVASYRNTSVYTCYRITLAGSDGPVESIWFAGIQNVFCFVDGRWWTLRERAGLPVTSFHAVALDDEQHLWIGTRDRGLYRSTAPITADALESAPHEPLQLPSAEGTGTFGDEITGTLFAPVWSRDLGAPTNQIESMVWHDGVLWVGTPVGLFLFEGSPPRVAGHYARDEGLQAANATALAFSPEGSLWVGTNGGLAEIDPAKRAVARTVTRQDGLVGNEVWFYGSVAVGGDGTVYFGTAQGLSLYAPRLDEPNPTPPLVRLRDARFHEDARGNNEMAVEYAALSYSKETRVRYRTRLVGYDRGWSAETAEVKTRYTNLPAFFVPRTYTFEVSAHNGDGVWSQQPLHYAFRVSPPLWFRWWALLGQFAIVGASLYGVHVQRTRNLERRAQLLEHVVEVRTQEVRTQAQTLQEQNVELEAKNAEIVRTQQQLIVQEKLASLGSLTAGIAHEIRNPLNFVNNFAELSSELVEDLRHDLDKQKEKLDDKAVRDIDDLLGDLEQNMARINEHGKRANSIVQGMLMHSRGQKGEFQRVDLNALLDEFANIAYLGMKANDPALTVALHKEFDPTVGTIDAIPQDLSRVFVNIVNNACYAVREKQGQNGDGYAPTVNLHTRSAGDRVEVRIRDNGNGIPDAVKEKVFAPFFTTKPTGSGTGLGLSISYDIVVQEHHGELRVDSKPGEFTEFVIVLPRANR